MGAVRPRSAKVTLMVAASAIARLAGASATKEASSDIAPVPPASAGGAAAVRGTCADTAARGVLLVFVLMVLFRGMAPRRANASANRRVGSTGPVARAMFCMLEARPAGLSRT